MPILKKVRGKIILGFVGDLAAGKGTVCAYLKKKYGCNAYRFSTMLRDVLDRMHIEKSRENLQTVSRVLRENFGQDLLSKSIVGDVVNDPQMIVAVEGIRRPTDVAYLEKLPGFQLIYLTAEPQLRWHRLIKRNENPGDDKKTFEQFLTDEQVEADQLIKKFGQQAKFTINNNGNFEEFYREMDKILARIQNENQS